MHPESKKILIKQRNVQFAGLLGLCAGFILMLVAKKSGSFPPAVLGMVLCFAGGVIYVRTACHISAIKGYDMGQDDSSSGKGYKGIKRLKDADISKEDFTL